jgi:DNA gyrase subunit A
MGRNARGRSLANVLELRPEEKIAAMIRIPSKGPGREDETWDPVQHIVFATRSGIVKKTNLADFKNIRKGGIIAIQIEEGDQLIDAKMTGGTDELVLVTHEGMSLRFNEDELRDQGRDTVGVWGIRPDTGDFVVAMAILDPGAMLLVAGENGIGKRTPFDEYRLQSRGGKGIITMKTGERTGGVVGALTVREEDELMLTTSRGQTVRIRVQEIREAGRNTMGVKLIDLPEGERLQDIAQVVHQDDDEVPEAATPDPATEA